jgi:3-deoxy-7-phosphoheptulonate synthase
VVLRGGTLTGPNYTPERVKSVATALAEAGLPQAIMVDCSHGNSEKDPQRQALVADSVAQQIETGEQAIRGVMLESNLVDGRQDHEPRKALVYGQSITDACLSFAETVPVLERLARAMRSRVS